MGPKAATVLSAGTEVQGDLHAGEDLRVEGVVRGQVVSDHEVIVAPGAIIEGGLLARRARVEGYVGADVQAHERLTVAATGQVLGDIRARELALAPGGRVRGRVETGIDVPLARWTGAQRSAHRPAARVGSARSTPGWTAPAATRETPPSSVGRRPSPPTTPAAQPSGPSVDHEPRPQEEVVEPSAPSPARGEVVEVEPVPAAELPR